MKADLNFLASYKMTNRHHMARSRASYAIVAMIIVVIAIIALTSLTLIAINVKDSITINNLKQEQKENEAEVQEVNALNKQLTQAQQMERSIKSVLHDIELSRMLDKPELNEIYNAISDDVAVVEVSYMRSTMVIRGLTVNKHSPSNSAESLNDKGISTRLGYVGFVTQEKDEVLVYDFTLICEIGGAGANE